MELGIFNSQQEQETAQSLRSWELSPTKATETWPTSNLSPFSSSPVAPWGWRGDVHTNALVNAHMMSLELL